MQVYVRLLPFGVINIDTHIECQNIICVLAKFMRGAGGSAPRFLFVIILMIKKTEAITSVFNSIVLER